MQSREPTPTRQADQPEHPEYLPECEAGPEAARARLASQLQRQGPPLSASVHAAFARVPRHVFVPEIGPAAAYRDEALVIKCGPDGLPVSSSSQPAMMAIMLDQLGLEPGHRVLEIGTGTGYNAAVMSAVVGPGGEVVTIDIDPELVARARSSLLAAGYDTVTVKCADGGYGDPEDAPFDRIIVTAGAWDIAPAWLGQLGPRGRLVLPLSVRGMQLSVGLRRGGEAWLSTSAWRCGFVRMMGAFAGPEEVIRLDEPPAVMFQISDGCPVDTRALQAALAGDNAVDEPVPVDLATVADVADLDLWLTMTASKLDRLTVLSAPGGWPSLAPVPPFSALVASATEAGELGVAVLMPADPARPEPSEDWAGAVIRGLGPGGADLAAGLVELSARWADLGRPGSHDLTMLVRPGDGQRDSSGDELPGEPPEGWLVVERPSVTIVAGWPVSLP
jgi:protein-L-isoaspartate(D-aspartate) O-methyltransferase